MRRSAAVRSTLRPTPVIAGSWLLYSLLLPDLVAIRRQNAHAFADAYRAYPIPCLSALAVTVSRLASNTIRFVDPARRSNGVAVPGAYSAQAAVLSNRSAGRS